MSISSTMNSYPLNVKGVTSTTTLPRIVPRAHRKLEKRRKDGGRKKNPKEILNQTQINKGQESRSKGMGISHKPAPRNKATDSSL